jgi:hypothetical protein
VGPMTAEKLQPAPKGCWAACLGDCDKKISREHTVSECLFESDEIMVQGFPWCADKPKKIGLANLVAKILCKKHNSALSDVDAAAKNAFDAFRESVRLNNVRQRLKRQPMWNVKRLVIDGPRLERWFLKTLINLSFGGRWVIGPGTHLAGSVSQTLVEVAFGLRQFQNGAGLYVSARKGDQVDSMDRVGATPMTYGEHLCAGRFNFRGFNFFLNLTPQKFQMDGEAELLYRDVTHNWMVQNRLSHAIYIRGW